MKYKYFLFFTMILVLLINTGCNQQRNLEVEKDLRSTITEQKNTIQTLRKKINEWQLKNNELNARVAELSVDDPDGLAIEGKRKALVEQEADFQRKRSELLDRETKIEVLEKSIREQSQKLATEKRQFIIENVDLIQGIGKAKQMQETYKDLKQKNKLLREERNMSENRANNWLITIYALTIFVFLIIIASLVYFLRYKVEVKKIDAVINLRDSDLISPEAKRLIDASLGRNLKYDDQ